MTRPFFITIAIAAASMSLAAANARADRWMLVGEHYHSTTDIDYSQDPEGHTAPESYRPEGISQLIDRGTQLGLEAMIVTEHNSVATCFDPLFNSTQSRLTLICGEEWTTHKSLHIGLLNPPVRSPLDACFPSDAKHVLPLEQVEGEARGLAQFVHAAAAREGRTSLVVVNHPGFGMYQPSDGLGADAAEAMVPGYEDPAKTRLWWLARLASGQRMIALGGSDYHACAGWACVRHGDFFRGLFDEPVNLVFAPSNAPDDVIAAMARGRVVALASAKFSRVRVELGAAFQGAQYLMGDAVAGVAQNEPVTIQIHIQNSRGLHAVLYGLGAPGGPPHRIIRDRTIDSDDFSDAFEVTKPGDKEAVHIELFDPRDWAAHNDSKPAVLTNPVYF